MSVSLNVERVFGSINGKIQLKRLVRLTSLKSSINQVFIIATSWIMLKLLQKLTN